MQRPVADFSHSPFARVRPVALSHVTFRDGFWRGRQRAVVENGIAHGYRKLVETGSIEALEVLAGLKETPLRGYVFRDSDVYKWLESVAFAIPLGLSTEMITAAGQTIQLLRKAQDSSGYINSSYPTFRAAERFSKLDQDHEIYCFGHLLQAGIAFADATADTELLDFGVRFAELLWKEFGPEGRVGACGHPVAEMALVELHRRRPNGNWLSLAERFLDARGAEPRIFGGKEYLQDHLPFREQTEAVGHAVRALYLYAGAADIYLETGDETLMASLTELWNDVQFKTYITGGVGSRHDGEAFGERHELPNARAYCETCAAIASVQWEWRMFAITGETKHLDAIETALYNGFLSGVSLDACSYFYVNPLESGEKCVREPWFGCACCPPNIYRTMCSVQGMVFSEFSDGVSINLFDNAVYDNGLRRIEVSTEYPWSGLVRVNVYCEEKFELRVRVPGWSQMTSFAVGDSAPAIYSGGWAVIERKWKYGDSVLIDFDMNPRWLHAHPRSRENTNCVALSNGPLVYCLESVDNLGISVRDSGRALCGEAKPLKWDALIGGANRLEFEGFTPTNGGTLPTHLCAIPYFLWANRGPSEMLVWMREEFA